MRRTTVPHGVHPLGKAIAVQADAKPTLFAETEKMFGKPAVVVTNAGGYA